MPPRHGLSTTRYLALSGVIAALCVAISSCTPTRSPPATVAPATPTETATPAAIIRGIVRGQQGALAGAWVEINGTDGERLVSTHTGQDGSFHVERPDQPFAITVTSPQGVAAFRSASSTSKRENFSIQLGSPSAGASIDGRVETRATPSGLRVEAIRLSDDEGDIFRSGIAPDGSFAMTLPAGTYILRVAPAVSTSKKFDLVVGQKTNQIIEASPLEPAPAKVMAWLKEKAIPIQATTPSTATDDLAPLSAMFGNAQVIGLGESTHGTAEFFTLKHRIIQRMAEHDNVTVVAMEANVLAAEVVNDFVVHGQGTVDQAVRKLFILWRTEEVRNLLMWMRGFNMESGRKTKLRFVGYDVQDTNGPKDALIQYLERTMPKAATPLRKLDALSKRPVSTETAEHTGRIVRELIDTLRKKRTLLRQKGGKAKYERALRNAKLLEQGHKWATAASSSEMFVVRDQGMADNIEALIKTLPSNERIVVWAHNGHIRRDSEMLLGRNMGTILKERLGENYLPVGFLLGKGEYTATTTRENPFDVQTVSIDGSSLGFAGEAFSRVGHPVFAIDIRSPPVGLVSSWLRGPLRFFSCGWLVSEWEQKGTQGALQKRFDALIFVNETSGAKRLPRTSSKGS